MATKNAKKDESIVITEIQEGSIKVVLVGRTPLILNRLSEKAKHELLMPKGRKTSAEKAAGLKHDPLAEYRSAPNTFSDPTSSTLLAIPAAAPKKAIASAALDIPGAKKAQIGRLVWVPGTYLGVYGLPQLLMSTVRSADMNRTPDIRTRAIVAEWAIPMTVNFVTPILNPTVILNLLNAAGFYIGIGDWRNEKGAGTMGQFSILSEAQAAQDKRVIDILKIGRQQQQDAMDSPTAFDDETEELLGWFNQELKIRGKSVAA